MTHRNGRPIAQPDSLTTNAGEAPFTRTALAFYDRCVLGLVCHRIWRCPTRCILDWYRQHLSANHLEVGVGTGLFLDRARFPASNPRLALLDLNPNCLERTAKRLARYRPEAHRANILRPIPMDAAPFDSIALNYVLHCLPGTVGEKGMVFDHLQRLLRPGGTIFGATVLHGGVDNTTTATAMMRFCNASGIFSNRQDTRVRLRDELERRLADVHIETRGSVALFRARRAP